MPSTALPLVVVLTGPTGSGKSELTAQLAEQLETSLPVEIVSVDSALVYRGMDIGTAKPPSAIRARFAHHLIDIRDPAVSYSAGEFVRDAGAAIADIHARGRLPLLSGGTMLYLRALYHGLASLPPACAELRGELAGRAQREGWARLHEELARVDPEAALRIAATDSQRIQRALEVHRLTGVPISRWQRATEGAHARFCWRRYALLPSSRTELHARLERRFAAMLEAGFLDEVRRLHERADLSSQHASMRAVGYRQLWQSLEGTRSLEEAQRQAVIATVQLAKRQLTWLRHESGLIALPSPPVGLARDLAAEILCAARAACA